MSSKAKTGIFLKKIASKTLHMFLARLLFQTDYCKWNEYGCVLRSPCGKTRSARVAKRPVTGSEVRLACDCFLQEIKTKLIWLKIIFQYRNVIFYTAVITYLLEAYNMPWRQCVMDYILLPVAHQSKSLYTLLILISVKCRHLHGLLKNV